MGGITLGKNKSKKEDLEWVSPQDSGISSSLKSKEDKSRQSCAKTEAKEENVLEKKEWSTWMYAEMLSRRQGIEKSV